MSLGNQVHVHVLAGRWTDSVSYNMLVNQEKLRGASINPAVCRNCCHLAGLDVTRRFVTEELLGISVRRGGINTLGVGYGIPW